MDEYLKIDNLPKTSPITIKKFKKIGILSYFDLVNYFPFRYEDYSIISKIGFLQEGEKVTITGQIIDSKYQLTKSGLKLQVFLIADETGQIEVGFYNQPYLLKLFKKNQIVSFAGEVERFGKKITLKPSEFELDQPKIHTGRIIPIYPEKNGLSSKLIREKIYFALNYPINEFLTDEIIRSNNLISEKDSYQNIHFPSSMQDIKKAKNRLSFDEFFLIQLSSALVKKSWQKEKVANKFIFNKEIQEKLNNFIKNLPFELTDDQNKVWNDIFVDLQKSSPMNRLLQGDVGSGKTVVAALASYFCFLNKYQTLFMAPTEILATQHYQTLRKLFNNIDIKISLLTSSNKKITKEFIRPQEADLIVGTHALVSKKNIYKNVGLVIIDEQHRFGVKQRAELKNKGLNPHLLTMTATPIPRTVALTLYGELDFSIINQMPKGRLPVKTFYIPKNKRNDCYKWIKDQINTSNSQVFIVCPLIDESEVETMKSIKAAKKEYENLAKIFADFKIGLLHGKMKTKEKEKIMNDFRDANFDILVTTPVVEVGVDIPGATIILIEAAERFGLAQLHQLRGRVGRNDKQSYCFLFSESENENIINRLKLFSKINNGSQLAEEDLKLRGPGDIFGTKQHGYVDLKIASFSDFRLIEVTKKAVDYFIANKDISKNNNLLTRLKNFQIEKISQD
ncbi:MAG: ATP-dependent DNA helicase RecG [Candidatus Microgenomates bacterium]